MVIYHIVNHFQLVVDVVMHGIVHQHVKNKHGNEDINLYVKIGQKKEVHHQLIEKRIYIIIFFLFIMIVNAEYVLIFYWINNH